LALQNDGKIIVAGYSIDNLEIFWISLARFTTDGLPDSSFGQNGQVKTDGYTYGFGYYIPTGMAIASGGKILVSTTNPGYGTFTPDILVLEYNTNGSVYNLFQYNSGGVYTRDISNAVAIQSTGNIVVAGTLCINDSTGSSFGLLRFRSNGSLDSSFGTDSGKTILSYGDAYAVTLQSNDKIIVLANSFYGDSLIARFTKNGVPDSSFGTYGVIYPIFRGSSIEVQPDGKIIITGSIFNGTDYDFAIARYTTKGKLDKTFGVKGIVATDFGENDHSTDMAIQTDGKIVVAGSSFAENHPSKCAVARYNGDISFIKENMSVLDTRNRNESIRVNISPNPFQSILNIEFSGTNSLNKRISIYDVNGKLLLTKSAAGNTQLDVNKLTAGTYVIKINGESGKPLYNATVIKQ